MSENLRNQTDDEEIVVMEDEHEEFASSDSAPLQVESAAIERTPRPSDESLEKTIKAPPKSDINIYDNDRLELHLIDPLAVQEADKAIRKGKTPTTMNQGNESIFTLSSRNSLLFYIIIAQCMLIPILLIFIIESAMSLPIQAKPNTKSLEGYQRAEQEAIHVETFAQFMLTKLETWSHYTHAKRTKEALPYLDPAIRGVFEKQRSKERIKIGNYKQKQVAEGLRFTHEGIVNETLHKVVIFYQRIEGRGEDDSFEVDGFYRRAKVLFISEAPVTAENKYGLMVTKHSDVSEQVYRDAYNNSPWDEEEGRKMKRMNKKEKKQ